MNETYRESLNGSNGTIEHCIRKLRAEWDAAVKAERERVLAVLEARKSEFCSNGCGWVAFDDIIEEIRAGT